MFVASQAGGTDEDDGGGDMAHVFSTKTQAHHRLGQYI